MSKIELDHAGLSKKATKGESSVITPEEQAKKNKHVAAVLTITCAILFISAMGSYKMAIWWVFWPQILAAGLLGSNIVSLLRGRTNAK